MATVHPQVVILAGPNGVGKSTSAPLLLRGALGVSEFVNADVIATGLSAFAPETTEIQAGKLLLNRIRHLADTGANFSFETTLASRTFAPWIKQLLLRGYQAHLVFLWLPSADLAVARVVERVRSGGHSVPEETIRRRYERGIVNFFTLYRPIVSTWFFYDNSASEPRLLARGAADRSVIVNDPPRWTRIEIQYSHGRP